MKNMCEAKKTIIFLCGSEEKQMDCKFYKPQMGRFNKGNCLYYGGNRCHCTDAHKEATVK